MKAVVALRTVRQWAAMTYCGACLTIMILNVASPTISHLDCRQPDTRNPDDTPLCC
jgi:hypothetical protein